MVVVRTGVVLVGAGLTVILIAILALTVIVTIGVHTEERRMSFISLRAPTLPARIARRVLNRRFRRRRVPAPGVPRPPASAGAGPPAAPDRDAA
jgi:hypothetical protein